MLVKSVELIDTKRDKKISLKLKPISTLDFMEVQDFLEANKIEVHIEEYGDDENGV